jgi:hypothetical protein
MRTASGSLIEVSDDPMKASDSITFRLERPLKWIEESDLQDAKQPAPTTLIVSGSVIL